MSACYDLPNGCGNKMKLKRAAIVASGICYPEAGAIPERSLALAQLLSRMGLDITLLGAGGGARICPWKLVPLKVGHLFWPVGNLSLRMNYDRIVSQYLMEESRKEPWALIVEHEQFAVSYVKPLVTEAKTACVAMQHCSVWLASQPFAAPFNPLVMWWWRRSSLHAFRESSAIIAVNEEYASHLRGIVGPEKPLYISPGGVPVDVNDVAITRDKCGGRILFVGRLSPEKNVPLLLRAAAGLERPGWHIEVIGSGVQEGQIRSLAERLGLSRRITFRGDVPHAQVLDAMRMADILVLPSWHESQGRVLLEAMSVGLPVIATAVGGVPELLGFGRYGCLVPSNDAIALRLALQMLLSDASARNKYSRDGRLRAMEYTVEAEQARDRVIFERILERSSVADASA